jgi:3-methyladenine DNA glycosylase AlkD
MFKKILQEYRQNNNPQQALPMAKYMQNRFTFLGLPRPERNRLQKEFIQQVRRDKTINWDFVQECWEMPEREYQYLAVDYLIALAQYLQPHDMIRVEALITAKSWWDTVDTIAVKLVGQLCQRYPELIAEYIPKWAAGENIWLIRTAILFQLKYKQATDTDLLASVIRQNNNSQELFANKAIGWALREYSKTDPVWVQAFVARHRLHPLSVKEGSKYIEEKLGEVDRVQNILDLSKK